MTIIAAPLTLEDIIVNSELRSRPSRSPDYESENNALKHLAQAMVDSPDTILQKIVETALSLCRAHTAGISLLEHQGGRQVFRWEAVAGVFSDRLDTTMPRDASPCGTTIDRDAPQLMYMAERIFPALKASPPIVEALLVPFHVDKKPVGTVWIVAHDESRKFDREDERITMMLAQFASVAWQLWNARTATEQRNRSLESTVQEGDQKLEVTQRKLQESQVLSTLGTTIAKIIHDLANPLNAISTTVQVLELSLKGHVDPQIAQMMKAMKAESGRVHDLMQELRQFTRPSELNLEPVNITTMLSEITDEVTSLCHDSSSIEIDQKLSPDLPIITADPNKLRRVFLNLCKNALEAMPSGGKLTISSYITEEMIMIDIKDTGTGIPNDLNVFEPFTTSKPDGWGLGLSIVRQIIVKHGGSLDYESELGKGTRFTISLPKRWRSRLLDSQVSMVSPQ